MAKSLRSKREKRLRTLRREIAEPFYDKKEAAKQAAQAAALDAPKLPVRVHPMYEESLAAAAAAAASRASAMGEPPLSLLDYRAVLGVAEIIPSLGLNCGVHK
uniref:Uncharacterized protein n=1 Tax=Aegilops tauschii subsp. strangulata TaxID=200361 RepID=A0A453CRV1_AEGTS